MEQSTGAANTGADLEQLLRNFPGVVARIDSEGIIQAITGATVRLYGLEPGELVGTQCLDLAHPADRTEAERRMRTIGEGENHGDTQMTSRVRHSDGRLIWVDSTARAAHDPEGGEDFIVFTAVEATPRMETESALLRVEARFRDMVEWLPAVVYEAETGPDGRFLYISPQIEEMLGYTPEEWVSSPTMWKDRIHPDEREHVLQLEADQERESRELSKRLRSEYRMVHRSERTVWVRDVARVCEDEDGTRFWRGVLLDISAERGAQAALEDAHERHRGMIDAMPACSYRAERRAMGRWAFVSAQIQPLLGYTPEEWCADPTLWRASLHADDRERVEMEEKRHMELPAGTEVVSEYRLRHRSGRLVSVRDRAILTRGADDELLIEGILTDISAERAAEAVTDGLTDVYRLTCVDCGASWAAARIERCPDCSGRNVESVSLNSALRDLAASRQQVEGLLDGIQKHLDALGTNLRSTTAQITPQD